MVTGYMASPLLISIEAYSVTTKIEIRLKRVPISRLTTVRT